MQADGGEVPGRTPAVFQSLVSLVVDIEDGQPDTSILKPMLNLLVGGQFDAEKNFRIKDASIVLLLLELARYSNNAVKLEIWSQLAVILQRSLLNVQACTDKDLLSHCLSHLLLTSDDAVADKIVEVLGAVVSYNITVPGLKTLFAALQSVDLPQGNTHIWPQSASRLVHALRYIAGKHSPDVFFSFNGAREAAVTIPPLAKWPTQPGFTIHTWIRLDPQPGVNMAIAKPFLYWFRTGKGFGYSAHFSAHTLVVTACSAKAAKGKPQTHQVAFPFQSRQWYMVSIVHTFNRIKANEVQVFVNGQHASRAELPFVTSKEPFDKCYLGTSPAASANDVFSGQMTAFYLFQEPLSADHISALYTLGSSYKGQFKFPGESERVILNHERKLLYDGKLSNSIVFMYSPKACDGQLCLESSPTDNPSFFVHSPHATLLEGVRPIVVHKFHSALYSIGGVEVLFPLFSHLDLPHFSMDLGLSPDYQLCSSLLQLLVDVLEQSTTFQQQMLLGKGFLVLSDLLLANSPQHLTVEAMDILLRYCNRLVNCSGQYERRLLQDVLRHVLFNVHLWIHTDVRVQVKLFSSLATLLPQWQVDGDEKGRGVDLRRDIGVPLIVDILQQFYYLDPSPIFNPDTAVAHGPRPDKQEIIELRTYILMIASQLVTRGKGIREDELNSILTYLSVEPELNVLDIQLLLEDLFKSHPDSLVPMFDRLKGVSVVFRLLHFPNENVRVSAIHILGQFLHHLPAKRLVHFTDVQCVLVFLAHHVSAQPFTPAIYSALFELMTGGKRSGRTSAGVRPVIIFPDVMVLLFQLLLGIGDVGRPPSPDVVKKGGGIRPVQSQHLVPSTIPCTPASFLRTLSDTSTKQASTTPVSLLTEVLLDVVALLDDRQDNCHIFIEIPQWQGWLLKFLLAEDKFPSEVLDLALKVLRTLLHHCVHHEKDGWHVFAATMALAHSESVGADTVGWISPLAAASLHNRSPSLRDPLARAAAVEEEESVGPSGSASTEFGPASADVESAPVSLTPVVGSDAHSEANQPHCDNLERPPVDTPTDAERDSVNSADVVRVLKGDMGNLNGDSEGVPSAVPGDVTQESSDLSSEYDMLSDVNVAVSPAFKTSTEHIDGISEESSKPLDQNGVEESPADDFVEVSAEVTPEREESVVRPPSVTVIPDSDSKLAEETSVSEDSAVSAEMQDKPHSQSERITPAVEVHDESNRQTESTERITPAGAYSPGLTVLEEVAKAAMQFGHSPLAHRMSRRNQDILQETAAKHMPTFHWCKLHYDILDIILSHVEDLYSNDTSDLLKPSGLLTQKQGQHFLANTTHLLFVVGDLVLGATGGLDGLVKKAMFQMAPFATSSDDVLTSDDVRMGCDYAKRLSTLAVNVIVRGPPVNHGIETVHGVSAGGTLRQVMRLVLAKAIISSLDTSEDLKAAESQFYQQLHDITGLREEATKAMTDLKLSSRPINKYLMERLDKRMQELKSSQSLFSQLDINLLYVSLFRKLDEHKHGMTTVLSSLYVLAKLLVVQYQRILDVLDAQTSPPRSASAFGPSASPVFPAAPGRRSTSNDMAASPLRVKTNRKLHHAVSLGGGQSPRLKQRLGNSATSMAQRNSHRNRWRQASLDRPISPLTEVPASHDPLGTPRKTPPGPLASVDARKDLTKQVEAIGTFVGPFLKDVFQEFSSVISQLKNTSDEPLVGPGPGCWKPSTSVVELVMLLCSQEWQMAIQRRAGSAFNSLVAEGNKLARQGSTLMTSLATEAVANSAVTFSSLKRKHTQLQNESQYLASQWLADEERTCAELLAAHRRGHSEARHIWRKISGVMSREFGPWAVSNSSAHSFLQLDTSFEDRLRRRGRFVPNPNGSSHPEAAHCTDTDDEEKIFLARQLVKQGVGGVSLGDTDVTDSRSLPPGTSEEREEEEDLEVPSEPEVAGRVVFTTECNIVTPGLCAPGHLTCTKSALYFAVDESSEEYKSCSTEVLAQIDSLHAMWDYSSITAIYSRRYLQQNTAAEIFFTSRASVFFNFGNFLMARRLVSVLPRVGAGTQFGLPPSRATSLMSPSQLLSRSNMTARWQRREVSNFEYLMFLNTISGRTYNDLNQYPVFPWILSNYHCKHLDLSDAGNYRDLTKPIGCLNHERLQKFEERYEIWEDDTIPAFHYGTHYSTAAFTMSWLIRVEPFTTFFLQLQSGKFDMPGRTFASMANAWQNCLEDTSDVKELIPEMFYLPEMFTNSNQFAFGIDNDGCKVNDVTLPLWASSPDEFVRLHAQALESDYVSANLHHWIDLVFGFKQRGDEAVKACNTFYYLTYEGSVKLDQIEDPISKKAIIQQIQNFGQTPAQLGKEPHPSRNAPRPLYPLPIDSNTVAVAALPITPDVPIAFIMTHSPSPFSNHGALTTISCNQTFAVNKWSVATNTQGIPEPHLEIDSELGTKSGLRYRRLGEPLDQSITPSSNCFAVTEDNRHVIAAGYWDYSFKCFATDSSRLVQSVFGHRDLVTCVAYSPDTVAGNRAVVVSGSRDSTVLVWYWSSSLQRIVSTDQDHGGDSASPQAILTGHELAITCVAVNSDVGKVVSCSHGGRCLVHTTSGEVLHSLQPNFQRGQMQCVHPHHAKITSQGHVVLLYADHTGVVASFTNGGKQLACKMLPEQALAITVSQGGQFIVLGGISRTVEIRRCHDLSVCLTYAKTESSVRALATSLDEKFVLAGLAAGNVVAFPLEWPSAV